MSTGLEAFKRIENKEAPELHSLWKDFDIPKDMSLPAGLNERYEKLGESGQDGQLRTEIGLALAQYSTQRKAIVETVSFNLSSVFNG